MIDIDDVDLPLAVSYSSKGWIALVFAILALVIGVIAISNERECEARECEADGPTHIYFDEP